MEMIDALFVYLTGLAVIYGAAVLNSRSHNLGRLFAPVSLISIGAIAVFRGDIGTDTASYENIVRLFRETGRGNVEPGFLILVGAIVKTGVSDEISVRLLSVLYVLTLIIYAVKADRRELSVLLLYFVPSFFYTYSMNALRTGLALNILLLSLQQMRRGGRFIPGITALTSILFHYSVVIPYIYALWTRQEIGVKKAAILVGLLVVAALPFIFLQSAYVYRKLSLYGGMESPGALSGVSYLLCISVLIIGVLLSRVPRKHAAYLVVTGAVFTVGAFVMSRFTYAGLRILELIATIYPFIVVIVYEKLNKDFDRVFKAALFLAGILNVIFVFRRFLVDPGFGSSPWLPYVSLF